MIEIPVFTHSSSWAAGGMKWRRHSGLMSQRPRFKQWLSCAYPIPCLRDIWWLTRSVTLGKLLRFSEGISPSTTQRWSSCFPSKVVRIEWRGWSIWNMESAQSVLVPIPMLFQQNQLSSVMPFPTRLGVAYTFTQGHTVKGQILYYK